MDPVEFVDRFRADLIQRISTVNPLADDLLQQDMINSEEYSNICSPPTSQAQMRELYKALKTDTVKFAFYGILREKESFLVQDLEATV
ncbi:hypothetical protein DPEC_G00169540 [Dallia pectoralis]|uniref:Uncharacterized protein n=1 Tax=Dallia pectoralis TaxID=75939 RepID=A0ACC2GCY4_DALPE|nr:hypothetical protein DPEC_G00169540 [Dallia pectoralis]